MNTTKILIWFAIGSDGSGVVMHVEPESDAFRNPGDPDAWTKLLTQGSSMVEDVFYIEEGSTLPQPPEKQGVYRYQGRVSFYTYQTLLGEDQDYRLEGGFYTRIPYMTKEAI